MFGIMEVLMICLAVINGFQALIVCLGFIIGLAIVILPIILFFKVWRMCDDVKKIKETLSSKDKTEVC